MKDMTRFHGRVPYQGEFGDARNGLALVNIKGKQSIVMFSDGGGWDHVSVSTPDRCPTWDEMCAVKEMFFEDEDVVVQYHPRKSEYRNLHPYTLHLWRHQHSEFPTPDPNMVAP